PIRANRKRADDIRHIDDTERERNAFDYLGASASHRDEYEHGGGDDERHFERLGIGHAQIAAEDRSGGRHTGELGRSIADAAEDEEQEAPERHLDAEIFTNQIGEALARNRAHAGAHLLHDDQHDGYRQKDPEQRVSELGAGLRVREDAADVVVGVGSDNA